MTFLRYFMSLILLLGVFPKSSYCQTVQHWDEKHGLASRIVNSCIRTSDGYLWIATAKGLCRFDGYTFLPINQARNGKLTSNHIRSLLEFQPGVLWVATDNGINVFNLYQNKVTQVFQHTTKENSLSENFVLQFYRAPDSTLWVTTADGILHKYLGNGQFKRFYNPLQKDLSFGNRLKVVQYEGKLWLRTQNRGVYQIDPISGKLLGNYLYGEPASDEGSINVLPKYGLICTQANDIKVYNPKTNQFDKLSLNGIHNIYNLVPDKKNGLWISCNERKNLIYLYKNEVTNITSTLFDLSKNIQINSVTLGRSNKLWVCTNNGLYKLILENPQFKSFLKKEEVKIPDYVASFRGMMQDTAGQIFAGGYGGLFKLEGNYQWKLLVDRKEDYSPSVLLDHNKDLFWMVSEGKGIVLVNKTTGAITKVPKPKDRYNYLMAAKQIGSNQILLGGYDELVWFNTKTYSFTPQKLIWQQREFQRPNTKHIALTKNKHIWVCTNHGIFEFSPDGKNILNRYSEEGSGIFKLPVNTINQLYEDRTGCLWAASEGGGLICIDRNKNTTKTITVENGLANNNVASILEDFIGRFWVCTFNGLSVIDPLILQINNYQKEDGLSDNEFNCGSYLKDKNGKLYFGGVNGINVCDPYTPIFPESELENKIIISKIELQGDSNQMKQIYSQEEIDKGIVLSQKSSYLDISFFHTDFTHADKNIFYYKLDGLNDTWLPLADRNYIRFASISPGDYTLRIKGTSSKNNFDTKESTLHIRVNQEFYKTWWFITLVILLLSSIVAWVIQMRFQKIREVTELRSKISSDLHDDVGGALTRVAMQAEILQDEINDPTHQEVLTSMVNSCRHAMSNMRDLIWSSDSRFKQVGNLFDKITEMVQLSLEGTPINYKLDFDPTLYDIEINQIQKQEIFFIIKEAIHNIIKHSKGDFAQLRVFKKDNEIHFHIYNNGHVATRNLNTGSGSHNMEMRAKRIKATLQFEQQNGYLVKLIVKRKKSLFI